MDYDKSKYKVWTWKHPAILHWLINPGLAVNELFLGQRIPKVMLIDKTSNKPLMERQFVPCPHCGELNNGLLWSMQNAFRNWFGYYCPNCGGIIPCLRNFTSLIIMIITYPLWFGFVDRWKKNWLKKQSERFSGKQTDLPKYKDIAWISMGLGFGGYMFVFMSFLIPFIMGEQITMISILVGIPVWLIAGLFYGFIMKFWMGEKPAIGK